MARFESFDTNGSRMEELSSSNEDDLIGSSPLRIQNRERKVAPVGAVARGYLDYTRHRTQHRPRLTMPLVSGDDSPESLMTPKSSISSGFRSLDSSPNITDRFGTVSLEADQPQTYKLPWEWDLFDSGSTKQGTTFHALPPEIRLLVFKEVLRVKEVQLPIPAVEILTLERAYPTFVNLSQQRKSDKEDSVLNVLLVCRIFYHEAVSIFYEDNLLRVSSPAMLCGFLNDLPRSRRQYIRRLRVGGLGFHYSGWRLATKAFSLLGLCQNLEHIELELAWDEGDRQYVSRMGLWRSVLEDGLHAATEGVRSSTVCLKALRGLKTITFHMVGDDNPLLLGLRKPDNGVFLCGMHLEVVHPDAFDKLHQAASLWATKIRSRVVSQGDCT